MISFHTKIGDAICQVEAITILCGTDVVVCIGGGQRKHIGASALAVPRPSLQDKEKTSATASVICVLGHKDDELARHAALTLASALNCCVTVTVGLHIDDAVAHDIDNISCNFHKLLADIEMELRKIQCPTQYKDFLAKKQV